MNLNMGMIQMKKLITATSEVILPLLQQKPELESKIHIASNVPEQFSCDVTKVKQVLLNLLYNAAKFTNRGLITLRVSLDSHQGIEEVSSDTNTLLKTWTHDRQFIKFTVQDTGVGIDPQNFEKIFSAFEQVSINKYIRARL
jgi:signal transduction histidine kinase